MNKFILESVRFKSKKKYKSEEIIAKSIYEAANYTALHIIKSKNYIGLVMKIEHFLEYKLFIIY